MTQKELQDWNKRIEEEEWNSIGDRLCKKCACLCKVINAFGQFVGYVCECDVSDFVIDWAVEEELTECNNYCPESEDKTRFKTE